MRTNFHTHTTRCKHAIGEDYAYIESAIEGGYDILGFSDHTPWPFSDGYNSFMRMDMDEVDGYVLAIRRLAERYRDRIDIRVGLECEYYTEHIDWLAQQRDRLGLDYMLFGNHFPYEENVGLYFGGVASSASLDLYLDSSQKALESGLFECFAHPDLFMRSLAQIDTHTLDIFRELTRICRDNGVVMERNTSIPFHPELWQIVAEEGAKVIIGMDAHDRKILKVTQIYDDSQEQLLSIGITPIKEL